MKALVGLLQDCTTSPINRFAALETMVLLVWRMTLNYSTVWTAFIDTVKLTIGLLVLKKSYPMQQMSIISKIIRYIYDAFNANLKCGIEKCQAVYSPITK